MGKIRAVMYFSAVVLAPAVVLFGMLLDNWLLIIGASMLGGYSLYAGINEVLNGRTTGNPE
jgi:hypothetical protein